MARLSSIVEEQSSESFGEMLEVFDEDGSFVGIAPRLLCHRLGLLHKAVFCFIVDCRGNMLLQTRGDSKRGRLDVAVGGHLSTIDASVEDTLLREIKEELGIDICITKLVKICEYLRTSIGTLKNPRNANREIRYLYVYELDNNELRNFNASFSQRKDKGAVISTNWFTLEETVNACDEGRAADGLYASISHYLLWKLNPNYARSSGEDFSRGNRGHHTYFFT
jgi:isopentenyldiphosphate isomerase